MVHISRRSSNKSSVQLVGMDPSGDKSRRQSTAEQSAGPEVEPDPDGVAACVSPSKEEKPLSPQASTTSATVGSTDDPISESYRSIIEVINRTSNGFKQGKKWKCSGGASAGSHPNYHHHQRRKAMLTQSRTVDHGHSIPKEAVPTGSASTDNIVIEPVPLPLPASRGKLNPSRGRRLVRQKATNVEEPDPDQGSSLASAKSTSAHTLSSNGALSVGAASTTAEVINETSSSRTRLTSPSNPYPNHMHHHLRVQRGLPQRQWTVDACTGLKTPMQEAASASSAGCDNGSSSNTTYLLRPVSRTSIVAGPGTEGDMANPTTGSYTQIRPRLSPSDRPRSPFPRSPNREKTKLGDLNRSGASSMNQSYDASSGGYSSSRTRVYEKSLTPHTSSYSNRQLRLKKQGTSESAPTGQTNAFGGSSRYLPRQHSNASAYSAIMPSSYSHQGITLVRGASCSLVDIPTYLGPSVAATGGVELAQMATSTGATEVTLCKSMPPPPPQTCIPSGSLPSGSSIDQPRKAPLRPRLQLDLTKKNKTKAPKDKESSGKPQMTVFGGFVLIVIASITVVCVMLSVGSRYQETLITQKWDTLVKNITEEPFIIVPDYGEDGIDGEELLTNEGSASLQDEDSSKNDTSPAEVSSPSSPSSSFLSQSPSPSEEPPFIFPEYGGGSGGKRLSFHDQRVRANRKRRTY